MKNKDHVILEQLYSKVKPLNIFKEEYSDKVEDNRFIADVENVNVYTLEKSGYLLEVEPEPLTLVYNIEIDFRKWGIKDFLIIPKKILPFNIKIQDDYDEEGYVPSKILVEFPNGVDVSDFKVSDVELTTKSSLFPTAIDLYIKKVGEKWEVVPQESEITF